jgi:outer membrane biosynthesis protein TonB
MRSSKTHADSEWQIVGFTISALLHLVLFFMLDRAHTPITHTPLTIDVSLEPPLPPRKESSQSIVSTPATTTEKPPLVADKLSDNNSQVEREQVKRGEPGKAHKVSPDVPHQATEGHRAPEAQSPPSQSQPRVAPEKQGVKQGEKQAAKSAKTAPMNEKPLPHLDNLLLDDSTLSAKFAQKAPEAQEQSTSSSRSARAASVRDYKAFSRPQGSGAAFTSSGGIRDFLPNLPDGDITLLNAKAATYAGFVRRVAVQVFGQLLSKGWDQLTHAEIRQLTSETTIEAVLSRDGKFLRANILSESGSRLFDNVVDQSVRGGARDPNPPAGAEAKDGLIHFIFKARSWSEYMTAPRTGAPVERRWILLATGLEE